MTHTDSLSYNQNQKFHHSESNEEQVRNQFKRYHSHEDALKNGMYIYKLVKIYAKN